MKGVGRMGECYGYCYSLRHERGGSVIDPPTNKSDRAFVRRPGISTPASMLVLRSP